jgi:hypothetical protein
MKIIFVCHDNNSIKNISNYLEKYSNVNVIFVGDKMIDSIYNERIYIARNDNHDKKLLTFTAWCFIIQNNLFSDDESLCILESDVNFDDHFYQELTEKCDKYDIISFRELSDGSFYNNINKDVLDKYLNSHNLELIDTWWPTTNHCIKRSLLHEFVNFYAFTYLDIYDEVNNMYSYHERVFSSYTKKNSRYVLNGLTYLRPKKYIMCYDDNTTKTINLIDNINKYSPETEVIRFGLMDKMSYGASWKPKMIHELLKNIEIESSLMYITNNQVFDERYYEYYQDYSYFKIWKNNYKNINDIGYILNHYKINIDPNLIDVPNTDIILFDNKIETQYIVYSWMQMCNSFIPFANLIPNYEDLILGIVIFIIKNNKIEP